MYLTPMPSIATRSIPNLVVGSDIGCHIYTPSATIVATTTTSVTTTSTIDSNIIKTIVVVAAATTTTTTIAMY